MHQKEEFTMTSQDRSALPAAALMVAIALAACAPAATQAPRAGVAESDRRESARSDALPGTRFESAAPAATQAPAAAPPGTEQGALSMPAATGPLPEQPGPRPIVVGGDRAPIEPTSVANRPAPTPVDTTFRDYGVNPFVDPAHDRLSTFALDVDTASYSVARKYVNDGILPPYEAVRAEEFVNYFAQDYAVPRDSAFAIYADGAASPFHYDGSYLMRIGVQGYDVAEAERRPAALTFVIDVSGSMDMDNRLGLVKRSLQLLVDRLRPDDRVSIVVFGNSARVVLPPTSGADRERILSAIYGLTPEGSTNTEAGLALGYEMATENHMPGGINRVIMCSDGVGNVGTTDPIALINSVKGHAPDDVMLTTIGFGMDNFNDVMLEQLANKGNGFYAYVDTLEEARKMFINRLTNSLQAIARDARVQVEFDPATVAQYRLIGYENRAVADQDFRDDRVDAGELNAGHNATAIYQVHLHPGARGKVATVFLRWQDPDTHEVQELSGDVSSWDLAHSFEGTSARFKLNATVAQFAEILRKSPYASTSLGELAGFAWQVARLLPGDEDVQELALLVQRASEIR
jgi:Ca-activated chloride channel family protein